MKKHHQLLTSLGATVVLADARTDFLIANDNGRGNAHLDDAEAVAESAPASDKLDFGSALKNLLTSTTRYK